MPEVGERLVSAELAESIELLARRPGALYEGGLAQRAVELLRAGGAPFSGDEWVLAGDVPAEDADQRALRRPHRPPERRRRRRAG